MDQEKVSKKGFRYPSEKFKEMVCLVTLGAPFFGNNNDGTPNPDLCLSNVYSKDNPYKKNKPGHITYFLEPETGEGIKTNDLAAEFLRQEADVELDELMDQLEEAVKGNPAAYAILLKVRKKLPFALMSYLANLLDNRERLLDFWRHAKPFIMVRKGKGFVLFSPNCSKEKQNKYLRGGKTK